MDAESILKAHNLKNTGCRKHIITQLLLNDSAQSEHEIKEALSDSFDRVTFYRSLKTLEEKNIIHRVILHDLTIKYALNKNITVIHDHAHFHCVTCNDVLCMNTSVNNSISLPTGFSVDSTQVLLEGTCPNCKINH